MLVLTRRPNEKVWIEGVDGGMWVEVIEVRGREVRLGFEGGGKVLRAELVGTSE